MERGDLVHRETGSSFTAWYEREAAGVCLSLSLALGDPVLAEEAAAEAFARAWADWRKVAAMDAPVGWVYRVALNVARDRFRRRSRERRAPVDRAVHVDPPAVPDSALWVAVQALPPRARLAVALRYVADLPEAAVAEVMGVARGTVAATLSSARRQLADALGDQHEEALP